MTIKLRHLVFAGAAFSLTFGMAASAETSSSAPTIESPRDSLLAEIKSVQALMRDHARAILASDGDRSTSELRQDASLWLNELAHDLDRGVNALRNAALTTSQAERREALALVKVKTALEETLNDALASDILMTHAAGSEAVDAILSDVSATLTHLQDTAHGVHDTRPVLIEMSFAEPVENEARIALMDRLDAFKAQTGIAAEETSEGVGTDVRLKGIAPVSLSSLAIRQALSEVWTQSVPELVEGAEIAPAWPEPIFVGVMLD